MDAERRRGFADVDDALFDTTRIPLTSRDIRTVGELLHDVDHTARHLLMDVAGDDAGRLLNGWPDLVTAAASLWSSLPGQGLRAGAYIRDVPITRLVSVADAIGRSLRNSGWPPASRPDQRMAQMTRTLVRARELVHRYGADIPVQRTESYRDLEAARARIMHSLYIAAHAVGLSLHQHGQDRYQAALGTSRPIELNQRHSPYAVPPTTKWIHRMAVAEAAASRYLDGRFTQTLAGEAIRPVEDDTRFSRALAGWDIQAHRALAAYSADVEKLRFNVCVAQVYDLMNRLQSELEAARSGRTEAEQGVGRALIEAAEILLQLIAPMMPHLAEECWAALGHETLVATTPWPEVEPGLLVDDAITLPVQVNGKRLDRPSYEVSAGDEIAVKPGTAIEAMARQSTESAGPTPAWLLADHDGLKGTVNRLPDRSDIAAPIEERLIVEHYSR